MGNCIILPTCCSLSMKPRATLKPCFRTGSSGSVSVVHIAGRTFVPVSANV